MGVPSHIYIYDIRLLEVNLRKLNELEVWKQYQIEITDRFAALENLKLADISGTKEGIPES